MKANILLFILFQRTHTLLVRVGDVVPGVVIWPSIFHIHAWTENRIVNRHETW